MLKNWSKLFRFWPWLTAFAVILVFLFWPFFGLTGDDTSKQPIIFLKIFNKTDHLPNANPKVVVKEAPENVLVFGGDIMLSRSVNLQMEKYKDYSWPIEKIYSLFSEANLAIANLESPFLVANNYQVISGSFSFKANPKSIASLSLAGFDVLSLANNHMLNQGLKGLNDTENILDQAGISYAGVAGKNLVVKESKGVKFAFLSYTYAADSKLISNMLDVTKAKSDIKEAKKQADLVIVLMHAGTEYSRLPNNQQINFAHTVIDAGADLVVGSHPHWPQSIENYQGKTIIYSLGNLVFDQMWSKETSIGLVAKVYFKDRTLDRIDYIPISIKDYGQAEIMPDGLVKSKLFKDIGIK